MSYLDVSGRWSIIQSNDLVVSVQIEQNGGEFTAQADYHAPGEDNGPLLIDGDPKHVRSMEARGTVTDREFQLAISWNNGTRGLYRGVVDGEGAMTGMTRDAMDSKGTVETWRANRAFRLTARHRPAMGPAVQAMGRPRSSKAKTPVDPTRLAEKASKAVRQAPLSDRH